MKNINTSLFDFPTLRDQANDSVYVDKTAQIYEIAKPTDNRICFFPRPRLFGKSRAGVRRTVSGGTRLSRPHTHGLGRDKRDPPKLIYYAS